VVGCQQTLTRVEAAMHRFVCDKIIYDTLMPLDSASADSLWRLR
jgi:hypothetical protein